MDSRTDITDGKEGGDFGRVIFGGILLFVCFLFLGVLWTGLKAVLFGFLCRPLLGCGTCWAPFPELSFGLLIVLPPLLVILFAQAKKKVGIGITCVWILSFAFSSYDYWIRNTVSQNFQVKPQLVHELAYSEIPRNENPRLQGRLLVGDEQLEVNLPIMAALPAEMRAMDWAEVETVITLLRETIQVGRYSDGSPAKQVKLTARVIDWKSQTSIGGKIFLGGQPSETVRSGNWFWKGSTIGDEPDILELLNWIRSLPKEQGHQAP